MQKLLLFSSHTGLPKIFRQEVVPQIFLLPTDVIPDNAVSRVSLCSSDIPGLLYICMCFIYAFKWPNGQLRLLYCYKKIPLQINVEKFETFYSSENRVKKILSMVFGCYNIWTKRYLLMNIFILYFLLVPNIHFHKKKKIIIVLFFFSLWNFHY